MRLHISPLLTALVLSSFCAQASAQDTQESEQVPSVEPTPIEPAPKDEGRKVTIKDDAGAPGEDPKKEIRANGTNGTVDVSVEFDSEGSSTTRNDGVFVFIEDSNGNIVESKFVKKDDGFSATLNPGETMYAADVNDPGSNTNQDTWMRDGNGNDVKVCVTESDA